MGLDHWQSFRSTLDDVYFDMLAPDMMKQLACMPAHEFFSMPHLLFVGRDVTLTRLLVQCILKRVVGDHVTNKRTAEVEVSVNGTKHSMKYVYSASHSEIDLEDVSSGQRQFLTEFIHRHLATTKVINPTQQKRIVVMHGMDMCKHQFALRKVLESCASHVMFIMTANSSSHINEAILSRCCTIRSSVPRAKFDEFCEVFMKNQGIDEAQVDSTDGITYTVLNMCAGKQNDGIEASITDHVIMLMATTDVPKIVQANREFAFKMLHFQVPCAHIFKHVVLALTSKKLGKDRLVQLVASAAELEHMSHSVAKPSIVIEQFLLQVWRHAHRI